MRGTDCRAVFFLLGLGLSQVSPYPTRPCHTIWAAEELPGSLSVTKIFLSASPGRAMKVLLQARDTSCNRSEMITSCSAVVLPSSSILLCVDDTYVRPGHSHFCCGRASSAKCAVSGSGPGCGCKTACKDKAQGRARKRAAQLRGVDSACPNPEMLSDLGRRLAFLWNLHTRLRERGPVRAADTARPAAFLQQLWMTLAASSAEADSVLSWNQ